MTYLLQKGVNYSRTKFTPKRSKYFPVRDDPLWKGAKKGIGILLPPKLFPSLYFHKNRMCSSNEIKYEKINK